MVFLPPEIIRLITTRLDKAELKCLRLVSRLWHDVATPLLFDRIYISPHTKDLDVFERIASHPVLAAFVKELLYDVSTFDATTEKQYFEDFCDEVRYRLCYRKDPVDLGLPPLFEAMADHIEHKDHGDLYSTYGHEAIIRAGFVEWQETVEDELSCFDSGTFSASLASGLSKLSNLKSVRMEDEIWRGANKHGLICAIESPLQLQVGGSPLARQWKPIHPCPQKPNLTGRLTRSVHLKTVINALSTSKRLIKQLYFPAHVDEGLPPAFFRPNGTDQFPSQMQTSLSQLQSLELNISPWGLHGGKLQFRDPVLGWLPDLLNRMTGLKHLSLDLRSGENLNENLIPSHEYEEACITYKDVFPRTGRWPHLISLDLTGLAISGHDFDYFFLHQIGRLNQLCLCHIDLLDGNWEGIMEIIYRKPSKYLSLRGVYRQNGGQTWPCHPYNEERNGEILRCYHDYIISRGSYAGPPSCSEISSQRHDLEILQPASIEDEKAIIPSLEPPWKDLVQTTSR